MDDRAGPQADQAARPGAPGRPTAPGAPGAHLPAPARRGRDDRHRGHRPSDPRPGRPAGARRARQRRPGPSWPRPDRPGARWLGLHRDRGSLTQVRARPMPRAGVLRARWEAGWAGRGPAQLRVSSSGLFMILDDPTAELSAISPVSTPAVGRLNSSDHGLSPVDASPTDHTGHPPTTGRTGLTCARPDRAFRSRQNDNHDDPDRFAAEFCGETAVIIASRIRQAGSRFAAGRNKLKVADHSRAPPTRLRAGPPMAHEPSGAPGWRRTGLRGVRPRRARAGCRARRLRAPGWRCAGLAVRRAGGVPGWRSLRCAGWRSCRASGRAGLAAYRTGGVPGWRRAGLAAYRAGGAPAGGVPG